MAAIQCERHQRAMRSVGGTLRCLSCLAAASKPAEQLWSDLQSRQNVAERDARLRAASIPEGFAGRGFDQFAASTPRAVKTLQLMRDYAANFATTRGAVKGFVYTGMPGTGKTHIACAVAQKIVAAGFTAAYASLPRLTRDLRASFGRPSGVEELLRHLGRVDLLVMDEIDLHGTSDNDYNTLYDVVNGRYEKKGYPTIAISNRPIDRLTVDLDERVISRILCGTSAMVFDWPGRRDITRRGSSGEGARV